MHGISEETRIKRSHFASRFKSARHFGFTAGMPGDLPTARGNAPYAEDELEFLRAIDRFKHSTGRFHPTPSDLLRIAKSLGYVRLAIAPPNPPCRSHDGAELATFTGTGTPTP